MRWLLLFVFANFISSGCVYQVGDASIFIEGKIIAEDNKSLNDCKLFFYITDEIEGDFLINEKEIDLIFNTAVNIVPASVVLEYYIKILCKNYIYISEPLIIHGTEYYDKPLNLGDIKLTHRKKR